VLVVLGSTRVKDPAQLDWLRRTLASGRADGAHWMVVAQHDLPLSADYHGSHPPSRQLLVLMFERFGVGLVLAGHDHDHDHDYQRSTPQRGVDFDQLLMTR